MCLFFSNPCIDKAHLFQLLSVIDIAAIDNDTAIHHLLDDIPRWHAELAPLGDEGEHISTVSGIVHVLAVGDGIADAALAFVHSDGIKDTDGGPVFQELVDDNQGRSLAHIVGLGLESKTDDGDGLSFYVAYGLDDLVIDNGLLLLVDTLHGLDHLHVVVII